MILVARSLEEFESVKTGLSSNSGSSIGLPHRIAYSCSIIAYKNHDKTYTVLKNRFTGQTGIMSNINFMCLLDHEEMFDDDEANNVEDRAKTYTILKSRSSDKNMLDTTVYEVWIDDKNYF